MSFNIQQQDFCKAVAGIVSVRFIEAEHVSVLHGTNTVLNLHQGQAYHRVRVASATGSFSQAGPGGFQLELSLAVEGVGSELNSTLDSLSLRRFVVVAKCRNGDEILLGSPKYPLELAFSGNFSKNPADNNALEISFKGLSKFPPLVM